MSQKRILNVSSRKKRNGMLSWTSTLTSGAGLNQPVYQGPAYVAAGVDGLFLWNATAQSLDATSVIPNQASRTATTCYMKGLAEHLRISSSSGLPWFHRRICFVSKNTFAPINNPGATVNPRPTYIDTTNGIERLWFNAANNNDTADRERIFDFLFRGVRGQDWTDPIIAPVDPTRVTVKYDRTMTIKSGNQVGTFRSRKFYHAMNKNIVYDDDESGESELQSYFSTQAKPGMGNYFVVDIFTALPGGTLSDVLRIDANSTLYWHER